MPDIEMTIDSIRHVIRRDEWVILIKEKAGQRCLPVYVNRASADLVARALRDETCGGAVDDEMEEVFAMGGEVALVIHMACDKFKARFVGQGK